MQPITETPKDGKSGPKETVDIVHSHYASIKELQDAVVELQNIISQLSNNGTPQVETIMIGGQFYNVQVLEVGQPQAISL